jgi:hypothetical protein
MKHLRNDDDSTPSDLDFSCLYPPTAETLTTKDRQEIIDLTFEKPELKIDGQTVLPPKEDIMTKPIPVEIQAVIDRHPQVFPDNIPPGLPEARATDHTIDLLPNFRPPGHRVYRHSPADDAELVKQIAEYQAAGWIRPAKSPFGAGVLFAAKKNGERRMCVDYRALNQITQRDVYPLPKIDELLDNLRGSAYFTLIDLRHGFDQIRVCPEQGWH